MLTAVARLVEPHDGKAGFSESEARASGGPPSLRGLNGTTPSGHSIAVAVMRSLAQNNAKQRVVDLETSAVFDETPDFRNLFMKKLTRDRVVPIISASVS